MPRGVISALVAVALALATGVAVVSRADVAVTGRQPLETSTRHRASIPLRRDVKGERTTPLPHPLLVVTPMERRR